MQNRKKQTAPPKALLQDIKTELQALNPQLKRLKVKQYYNQGKVAAHADLGSRRIYIKSHYSTIKIKFIEQYDERVQTCGLV